jgi:A/G-specific adenine glycosylase
VKEAKRQGRLRRGAAFVVLRADGAVLVRRRPAKGLLGGMTEVPTTAWTVEFDAAAAMAQAPVLTKPALPSSEAADGGGAHAVPIAWRRLPGVVTHVFTHFPLELIVYVARARQSATPPVGTRWVAAVDLAGEALPNLMRKVLAHAGIRLS